MLDFLVIKTRLAKNGVTEIYPIFVIKKSADLMIKGGDFYAIWCEDKKLWSTDEQDAIYLIDRELEKYAEEYKSKFSGSIHILYMWDSSSGVIDSWHKYCQKQSRDNFHLLDENIIFSNVETVKKDYASKKLPYALESCPTPSYDQLISTLYSPEEREKIEWAIGSIIEGDSKKIQKFIVLYGEAGTGKSTVLNIIQQLFEGYYSVFDARALASANNAFSLESLASNPLVAIQHDGDLSHIEDNTKLNSLVSHEMMTVNAKYTKLYSDRFRSFLFLGTNKPVKITDAKSGLLRRLIDVSPTGDRVPLNEFNRLVQNIKFELGGIASHCRDVYLNDKGKYDNYIPLSMMESTNDFFNFINDNYLLFNKEGTSLKMAWDLYNTWCNDTRVLYPLSQRAFKEELKNYFKYFEDRHTLDDGTRVRSWYYGLKTEKFEKGKSKIQGDKVIPAIINFRKLKSVFDEECKDCKAQYANGEIPGKKWSSCDTTLKDIDTSELHYVKLPLNHIVIDFDIQDEDGNKSIQKNMEAASLWPPTYGELSKSGSGIHLHYIYAGDPETLSKVYDEHIEIKVFKGNSSLRRKYTKSNGLPIATISSGLPLKEEKSMIPENIIKDEQHLKNKIIKALKKEVHQYTKPNMDYIKKVTDDAYNSGLSYDISDLRQDILQFAMESTHNSEYCLKIFDKIHWTSREDIEEPKIVDSVDKPIIFCDVEVFPNLLLINWKLPGKDEKVVRMINPDPEVVEKFIHQYRLIGFNNRRYDNHILWARANGYTNQAIFDLSQSIIKSDKDCFFKNAFNISYTDIYDYAKKKQSLKKWEIELGIHHKELGMKWNEPVPEDQWELVAEYCDNDVIATEEVWNHTQADFRAREILADLADMTVNDTTNSLTTKIIFGGDRNPQTEFNYRNLAEPVNEMNPKVVEWLKKRFPNMMSQTHGKKKSILPYWEGYTYDYGKSLYKGIETGEGGYVEADPGIYGNVALLDVVSMHPHSLLAECYFGVLYSSRFGELLDARVAIKHRDIETLKTILNGKLIKYLDDDSKFDDLAGALKIAINSVYGLTCARFDNVMKDPRNKDNIVAKRGALFMIDLAEEVKNKGFTVAHIKTDSIKIPDATPEIISFVKEFGEKYGYTFEHEATYEKMALVNNAVYIAKYLSPEKCESMYGYIPGDNKKHPNEWTATGAQFAEPYVFKTLFSKENIEFSDLCVTNAVTSALYLDNNEGLGEDEHDYHFIGKVGSFVPVKEGCGGGYLMRENVTKDGDVKYSYATGTKGYRWKEAENASIDEVDLSYFNKLVDDAYTNISTYGDAEWFCSDAEYEPAPFAGAKIVKKIILKGD